MKNEYRARKGARFNDKDAAVIGAAISELGSSCTASDVVSAAKRKSSPLHRYFQWDDTRAAELYRLDQARYYLRHVEIVIVRENDEQQTRAWHQIEIKQDDATERVYMQSVNISLDPSLQDQVIARALRELQGWKARYSEYNHVFSDLFSAISKTQRRVSRKKAIPA
jgi:hypothetical protein